jgi:hypothetical protein
MKRILSLDGGGIHGVFTLQVLRRVEDELRSRNPQKPDFVLADYFDLIAGTSTGAIIAAMLAWGARVEEIDEFYRLQAPNIFYPTNWWRRRIYNRFSGERIAWFLQKYFSESDGNPALLGSARLKSLLLVVLRDATTGSAWPLTNNPTSKYNDRAGQRSSNLDIPLWSIVRASTAAPTFFPAERIVVGSKERGLHPHQFIDGGVSPYNNPAYLAYLMATMPEYQIAFPRGVDRLHLVSIGVGQRRSRYFEGQAHDMHVLGHVRAVIRALMDGASVQQDILCRTTGVCLFGAAIDNEIGDLIPPVAASAQLPADRQFCYVRYNHTYTDEEIARALETAGGKWDLANLGLMPTARAAGTAYAAAHVRPEHLL